MIRVVLIVALSGFLVLFFFLPTVYTAERLTGQIKIEHELNRHYWGERHALQALSLTMDLHGESRAATRLPAQPDPAAATGLESLGARQLEQVAATLLRNPYTAGMDALVLLLLYRLVCLLMLSPIALLFLCACLADGFAIRWVRSKEFRPFNPEIYATAAVMCMLTTLTTLLAFLFPVTFHPFAIIVSPLLISALAGWAVSHYHARG